MGEVSNITRRNYYYQSGKDKIYILERHELKREREREYQGDVFQLVKETTFEGQMRRHSGWEYKGIKGLTHSAGGFRSIRSSLLASVVATTFQADDNLYLSKVIINYQ